MVEKTKNGAEKKGTPLYVKIFIALFADANSFFSAFRALTVSSNLASFSSTAASFSLFTSNAERFGPLGIIHTPFVFFENSTNLLFVQYRFV